MSMWVLVMGNLLDFRKAEQTTDESGTHQKQLETKKKESKEDRGVTSGNWRYSYTDTSKRKKKRGTTLLQGGFCGDEIAKKQHEDKSRSSVLGKKIRSGVLCPVLGSPLQER